MGKRFKFEPLNRLEEKVKEFKTVLSHLGLYCGLILYTAIGAWVFILIEHPVEREKLSTLQDLLLTERQNFLGLVYNLTSRIDRTSLSSATANELYSPETIKTMLLSTNKFRASWERQEFYSLENLVHTLDQALLSYERTLAVAAGEGINVTHKDELRYKWTYVQSVFFSSTIITTVGYGNIAPVTTGGRVFCILFAIIGIPFTLSVIADVGQITATIVTTLWAKAKPIITPWVDRCKAYVTRLKDAYEKRRRRTLKEDNSDEEEAVSENGGENENDDDDDDDPMQSIGIGTNVIMAFVALGFLSLFLGIGSYVFTHFERWSFFDAFYFCFITMTTIGFGDIVPNITTPDSGAYMFLCMIYMLVGLAVTSTIIELVRRQYAESWQKMQELRAQIQAQLKLADHLRKMAEQGRDLEGMDVDLDELRHNLNKLKKGRFGAFLGDFDFDALDCWINNKKRVKAVTIFFYETSL